MEPTWCLGRCSSRCSGGGLGHLSQAPPAGDSPRLRVAAVHVPLHQRLRPRLCPAGAPPWVTVQGGRSSRGLRCDPQGFPWPSSHTAWHPMALRGRQGAGCLACRQCGRPRDASIPLSSVSSEFFCDNLHFPEIAHVMFCNPPFPDAGPGLCRLPPCPGHQAGAGGQYIFVARVTERGRTAMLGTGIRFSPICDSFFSRPPLASSHSKRHTACRPGAVGAVAVTTS